MVLVMMVVLWHHGTVNMHSVFLVNYCLSCMHSTK